MTRSIQENQGRESGRTALQEAVRMLARRPLTGHEVTHRLRGRGYGQEEVEAAVRRLQDDGYLDDLGLSIHFITVRAERKRHGPRRLLLDLEKRGVAEDVARRALRMALEGGEIDPSGILFQEAEKRVGALGGKLDRRSHHRVYNALLRAGFEPRDIHRALERYIRDQEGAADEY